MKTLVKTQNHSAWECKYHVVIIPKYRKKILYGVVRQRAGEVIKELLNRIGVELLEGHACVEHIHMLLSIPPKYSVSYVIGYLKGKSAIKLHLEFGKKKNQLTQKSFWSKGYYVSTVGVNDEVVKKYIQNQWKQDKYIDGDQQEIKWE